MPLKPSDIPVCYEIKSARILNQLSEIILYCFGNIILNANFIKIVTSAIYLISSEKVMANLFMDTSHILKKSTVSHQFGFRCYG